MNNLQKSIKDFLDENTKLRAVIAEAQTYKADAERLEWIHNEFKRNGVISFKKHGLEWAELFTITTQYMKPQPTIREAIDKAMKESK